MKIMEIVCCIVLITILFSITVSTASSLISLFKNSSKPYFEQGTSYSHRAAQATDNFNYEKAKRGDKSGYYRHSDTRGFR